MKVELASLWECLGTLGCRVPFPGPWSIPDVARATECHWEVLASQQSVLPQLAARGRSLTQCGCGQRRPLLGKPWPSSTGSVAVQSRHDLLHLPAAVLGVGRPVPQYRHAQ